MRPATLSRDTCSPLWVLRCASLCRPCGGEVQHEQGSAPTRLPCWLGSAFSEASAREYAVKLGLEIVA